MVEYQRPQSLSNTSRYGLGGRVSMLRVGRTLPLFGIKDELFLLSKSGDADHGKLHWWDDDAKAWTVIGSPTAAAAHNLLSATHPDTTAAGVSRGSLVVGNLTPKWVELVLGAAGKVLTSDGTDAVWGDAGVTDHALLSNLDYASAAHTGFLAADGSVAGATSQPQDFGSTGIKADEIAESTGAAGITFSDLLIPSAHIKMAASGEIQDSGGTARLKVRSSSPHIEVDDDFRVERIGLSTAPLTTSRLAVTEDDTWPAGIRRPIYLNMSPTATGAVGLLTGITVTGTVALGTNNLTALEGFRFVGGVTGDNTSPPTIANLITVNTGVIAASGAKVNVTNLKVLRVGGNIFGTNTITNIDGIHIEDLITSAITNTTWAALRIDAQDALGWVSPTNFYGIWQKGTVEVNVLAARTTIGANSSPTAGFELDVQGDIQCTGQLDLDGDLNHDGSNVGFYATAPIAKQTGVAVTPAGIHAALVNLGLITA